jgi:predicted HNH restriction endonuclease
LEKHENIKFIVEALSDSNELVYVYEGINEDSIREEYSEGKESFRMHRFRERNSKLVKEAKKIFKSKFEELYCEACGINFEQIYGERGKDFIEAHHTKPISEMKLGEKTKIEDIAMLCSNCHRMIHKKPLITVEELKTMIK